MTSKYFRMAAKELRRRGRATSSDLAAAVTRGERRPTSDTMERLANNLAFSLVEAGIARRVGQTSILELVGPHMP